MPLNKQQTELDLRDLMNLIKKEMMFDMNCHGIGTVKSFDADNMTVTATMNYTQEYYQQNANGQFVPTQVPYPILVDCPAIFLGGGSAGLSFPIAPANECLILFNDRDLDAWFTGATTGPPATNRLHSFSDGMALVWNTANPGYDADRAVLYNGLAGIGVSSAKVKIYNATTTLGTILDTMLTAMGSATTVAQVAAAATAAKTSLDGLLE